MVSIEEHGLLMCLESSVIFTRQYALLLDTHHILQFQHVLPQPQHLLLHQLQHQPQHLLLHQPQHQLQHQHQLDVLETMFTLHHVNNLGADVQVEQQMEHVGLMSAMLL